MNFFKSILSEDPDPPKPEKPHEPGPNSKLKQAHEDPELNDVAADGNGAGAWGFGGLIKTLADRSESLIETYRRDLEEFGSGLKKETEIIREAASRAVKELPASIDAGSSAAHGVLDGVLKSTAEIISTETESGTDGGTDPGRYGRFGAQLSLIRSDLNMFCEEPEDVEEYRRWKVGFRLEDKRDEIEGLIGENGELEGVYAKIVPGAVDCEAFFCRYFYRVAKLEQRDRVRVNFVRRAISVDNDDEDDELSWDVDDEGPSNGSTDEKKRGDLNANDGDEKNAVGSSSSGKSGKDVFLGDKELKFDEKLKKCEERDEGPSNGSMDEKKRDDLNANDGDEKNVVGSSSSEKSSKDVSLGDKELKFDEKLRKCEERDERTSNEDAGVVKSESGGKCDVSVVSNREAETEEEDLGWGEIEDDGNDDEKKIPTIAQSGRPNRAKLRERLSGEEDEEDLSWDIEDDDDPVKS